MESKAKIFGHSIHQMLIVFPLGLLATGVIFDLLHLSGIANLAAVAYWMIAAGIVGGLVAAPFGWIDWFAIPRGTRAKSVGLLHGFTNVGVLVLFAASWLLRPGAGADPDSLPLIFSFAGAGLALVGGWLGGELVSRLGVGVYEGAHLNSPNSLSGRPAGDHAERTIRRTAAPQPIQHDVVSHPFERRTVPRA